MPEKRRPSAKNHNNILPRLFFVITSFLVSFEGCVCLFAFLITRYDFSEPIAGWMALFSVSFAMFVCGYIAVVLFYQKGGWIGLAIAAVVFLTILCIGILSGQTSFTLHSLIVALFLLISSFLGSNVSAMLADRRRVHH